MQFPVRSKLTLLQHTVAQVSRGGRAVVVWPFHQRLGSLDIAAAWKTQLRLVEIRLGTVCGATTLTIYIYIYIHIYIYIYTRSADVQYFLGS